jgi:GT2 family glycosyltransferase
MDDDILPEQDCLQRLYNALTEDPAVGGVSSMITNQQYQHPGRLSRLIIRILGGTGTRQDAGRLLSGVRNVLPASDDDLPEIQPVEWLNTTCTLYRRDALPLPVFPPHFHGASVCEDLALSLVVVRRGWKIANARLARIFHDSQGGEHKADHGKLIEEEFTNRAYILRRILNKTSLRSFLPLLLSQGFEAVAKGFTSKSLQFMLEGVSGTLCGVHNSSQNRLPPHYIAHFE